MRRSPNRAPLLVVLLAGVACSSSKEWEPLAGSLALYAEPLAPTVGQPLVLGVDADHVGPIDIFQGAQRIASLANVSFDDGRIEVRVTARSNEVPRAVTTAYDYQRLEVEARAFPSAPRPIDEDDGGPALERESCPGASELAAVECSSVTDAGSVSVRMQNQRTDPISVYELPPGLVEPSRCELVLVTLLDAGVTREFTRPGGTVLRVVDDRSNTTLRLLRLPSAADACTLVVTAR